MPEQEQHDFHASSSAQGGEPEPEAQDSNASLEDAACMEQEYVRERLREELGREPSEEELSEWLREHTEGY